MRRLLVAVGVVVLLAAGAAPAEAHSRRAPSRPRAAPSAATWDRLAKCESGGNWHIRGRTYSGGLQFDARTWRSVGGRGVAADASKGEQIARATDLHSLRGWKPWPGCSRKLKLR